MKTVVFLIMFTSLMFGAENVSLSKLLIKFQGNEYNVLLAPKHIVLNSKGRKTRKAINKGYKRAVSELIRLVAMRDLDLNIKNFKPTGSNLKQYVEQDSQSFQILKEMLISQVTLSESINFDESQSKTSTQDISTAVSAEDIDVDMDFGDDAFDISEEKVSSAGSMSNISPAEAFRSSFIELSELYNQQVLQLYNAKHPFNVKGVAKMKPVHSVFGMAFFPSKEGSVKTMRLYIVLCNINTEENQSVQIIAKEVKAFRWDRNHLYISGATGKILRQIVSGVLGESFL